MIPDSVIRERIAGRAAVEGRADDASEATISNRIASYHAQTEPLVDFYRKAGKYFEVQGYPGSIEEVRERVLALVESI